MRTRLLIALKLNWEKTQLIWYATLNLAAILNNDQPLDCDRNFDSFRQKSIWSTGKWTGDNKRMCGDTGLVSAVSRFVSFCNDLVYYRRKKEWRKKWVMHMLPIRLQSNTARVHRWHAHRLSRFIHHAGTESSRRPPRRSRGLFRTYWFVE